MHFFGLSQRFPVPINSYFLDSTIRKQLAAMGMLGGKEQETSLMKLLLSDANSTLF
jgi:hypothetical protein